MMARDVPSRGFAVIVLAIALALHLGAIIHDR